MAWVYRNGKDYYYRSKWRGGRVETEVFSGRRAIFEAQADEEAKYKRQREAEQFAEEDGIDAEIETLFGKIEDVTAERPHEAGYHQHKREWRRRRGGMG